MTRLYLGKVSAVLGGLRRMQHTSDEAAQAIANSEHISTSTGGESTIASSVMGAIH